MTAQARTEAAQRAPREINGSTWGEVPGQSELHLFPEQWFECRSCSHEVHVDSTPLPGDYCWQCSEGQR